MLAYAAKVAQGLTYASVGNDGASKLQTDVENKVSIAQGLSGTSSAFIWPRMYVNTQVPRLCIFSPRHQLGRTVS